MSCDCPNLAIFEILPYSWYNGKTRHTVDPPVWRKLIHMEQYNPDHVDVLAARMRFAVRIRDKYDRSWHRISSEGRTYEYCLLPCGQCISCRLEYSRQWAMRCVLEASQHEFNYFVTLTYSDSDFRPNLKRRSSVPVEFDPVSFEMTCYDKDGEPYLVPRSEWPDYYECDDHGFPLPCCPSRYVDNYLEDVTGEIHDNVLVHPLQPDDLQLFLKRLRKHFFTKWSNDYPREFELYKKCKRFDEELDNIRKICPHMPDIRFYAVGEYGPKTLRPHYHIILFNCPLSDIEFRQTSEIGHPMYVSNTLSRLWPYGFHIIEECSFQACAYVARYMLKKHKGLDADWYQNHGLEPEFSRCSRRPGIARKFYDENNHLIYERDSVIVDMGDKKLELYPPKYYDRIFADHHPFEMEELRDKRRYFSALQEASRFAQTGQKRSVYDANKAAELARIAKALPRGN